jgi:hypothetical protein
MNVAVPFDESENHMQRFLELFLKIRYLLRPLVFAYGMMLVISSLPLSFGQPRPPAYSQDSEIAHRIEALESQKLDHRLTVLETVLDDLKTSSTVNKFASGGTGLLLIEAVFRVTRRGSKLT